MGPLDLLHFRRNPFQASSSVFNILPSLPVIIRKSRCALITNLPPPQVADIVSLVPRYDMATLHDRPI